MFFEMANIIIILLEAFCCFLFFDVFQPQKVNKTGRCRKHITFVIVSGIFILFSFLLSSDFILRQAVVVILVALTMSLIMGYGYVQALVLMLFYQGLLLVIEYLGLLMVKLVVDDSQNMTPIEEIKAMNITLIDLIVLLLCIILVRRAFRAFHNEAIFRREWIKFIIFPLVTNIILIMTTTAFNESVSLYQAYALYGVGIGLVIMNYFVFYLLDDTIKTHRIVKNEALFRMQKKDRMEMYAALYDNLVRLKAQSHDFHNHIMCLKTLVDNNEIEETKEYLGRVVDSDVLSENLIDTRHVIINAILNTKYVEAASKDIGFVMKLNDLSNVWLQNEDLVVILSNLLNNAIEATEKCTQKKYVYIKMEDGEEGVIISIKNPYSHMIRKNGEDYISSKNNSPDVHGIGLKNVRKVVEKYNGICSILDKGGFFVVTVIIPRSQSKNI